MVVPAGYVPEQGDIIRVDFDPQAGREQAGGRPALVVSAKSYNKASRLCLCCPITHRQKGYPFEIELPKGLTTQGVILSDQIRSLDWEARRAEFVDDVPLDLVQAVLDRLNPLLNE